MEYRFKIDLKSNDDSNLFLRCLWSNLGDKEPIGWQVNPVKDYKAQKLFLGWFSSNRLEFAYGVDVTYKTKGCLDTIIFISQRSNSKSLDDKNVFDSAIEFAKNYQENIETRWLASTIKSSYVKLINYKSSNFILYSANQQKVYNLYLKVHGFGCEDYKTEYLKKFHIATDVLASLTNDVFVICRDKEIGNADFEFENIFIENDKFDKNVDDKEFLLSERALQVISNCLSDSKSPNINAYKQAANLFHQAKKYSEIERVNSLVADYYLPNIEVANTLFMSSLEVLASIDNDKVLSCPECNQPVYSIRKRVLSLVESISDSNYIRNFIDDYYKSRSSFVHSGIFYSDKSYTGSSLPQIDASNNLKSQISIDKLSSLSDYIGFIFRVTLNEEFISFD